MLKPLLLVSICLVCRPVKRRFSSFCKWKQAFFPQCPSSQGIDTCKLTIASRDGKTFSEAVVQVPILYKTQIMSGERRLQATCQFRAHFSIRHR